MRKCGDFITKCDSYCKIRRLLQNATDITKCDVYYKMRQFLQNAAFIANCDSAVRHVMHITAVSMQLTLNRSFFICFLHILC